MNVGADVSIGKEIISMPTATKTTRSQFDGLPAHHKKQAASPGSGEDKTTTDKPKAKSKNPDYRAATLYLRKKTLTEAEYKLKSMDDERDMSELAEDLMAAWLAKPTT